MKRILSMFLALCMVGTLLPVSTLAEETYATIGGSGEIISFALLTETGKEVSLGTSIEDLELPETLTATVRTAAIDGEGSVQDSGSPFEGVTVGYSVDATTGSAIGAEISESGETGKATGLEWEESTVDIPVRWVSPDYDMNTEGEYVFTPVIAGYAVSTPLPKITVTVGTAIMGRGLVGLMSATTYNIWVGGVQVTEDNKGDVLGDADGGAVTVTYDPTSSTLTLNGATITTVYDTTIDGNNVQFGIYSEISDLKLVVTGTNSITSATSIGYKHSYAIYTTGKLEIFESGSGSLTAESDGASVSYGISSEEKFTISSGTISGIGKSSGTAVSIGIYGNPVEISGGEVTATATATASTGMLSGYSITVSGGKVTASGKTGLTAYQATYPVNIFGGEVTVTGTGSNVNNHRGIGGRVNLAGGTLTAKSEAKALNGSLNLSGVTALASTNQNGDGAVAYNAEESDSYKYLQVKSATAIVTIAQADAVADIQNAIQTELDKSDITTVVVDGSKSDADQKLELTIPDGKIVQWEAAYQTSATFGGVNDALINLASASQGTLAVTENGLLDGGVNSVIYSANDSTTDIVVKGMVQNNAVDKAVLYTYGNIIVTGANSVVENTNANSFAKVLSSSGANKTITVSDGAEVIANGNNTAVLSEGAFGSIVVDNATLTNKSVSAGNAIARAKGDITVQNGGKVIMKGNATAVNSSAGNVTVTGTNSVVENENTATASAVIYTNSGDKTVTVSDGGRVIANGYNSAINAQGTITVTGANSAAKNTNAVAFAIHPVVRANTAGKTVTVSDGAEVSAKGNQAAILSAGNVTVNGKVTAANGSAVILNNDAATVTVGNGGLVFSPQGIITKTTTDSNHVNNNSGGGVILKKYASSVPTDPRFVTITGTGMAIGWDKAQYITDYTMGATNHIARLLHENGGTAVWAEEGGQGGIRYTNGANTGFIPLDVTLSALIPLPTPTVAIDYVNETLTGFVPDEQYSINGSASFTISYGEVFPIHSQWMGRSVSIVRKGNGTTTSDSPAQTLSIPTRPSALTGSDYLVEHETTAGASDGKLKVTIADCEYRSLSTFGGFWLDLTRDEWVENLAPGNYLVRKKAVAGTSFASDTTLVIINAVALAPNLSVADVTLDAVTVGYMSSAYKSIVITNSGDATATISNVTTDIPSVFSIHHGQGFVTVGSSINSWDIRAATGLAAGTYNATITVTYDGGRTVTATVSITVNAVGNHTITFNPNGGTVSETSRSVTSDTAVGTLPTPTRSGSYSFDGWYTAASGGTQISASTIVSANVTYYAHWTYTGGGGRTGGSGSSSNDNSSPVIVTLPAPDKPDSPTQGEIKVPGTVDGKGNVTVSITDKTVTDAFDKALAEARKNGVEQNGITVVLRVDAGNKTGSHVTVNLPKAVQDTIIVKKIVNTIVVVDNQDIRIGMDLATVKEINKQAKSDVNITATRADSGKLTAEAKKAIGSRPVFDLKVSYSDGKTVSSFGAGSVSVTISYTLGANEKAGNVQAVYVDANGKVHWLVNSVYDSVEKVLRFATSHFSTYGIGYKQANTAFTDIAGHWAKEDVEFVASRGLFSGTSETKFSPNAAMTRGMFVTALGRLANADASGYAKSSFSDVRDDAYYKGCIEWASKNNIVNGVGNGKFAPDQSITREQMAAIMSNYAKTIGYTLPKVHVENTFADNGKISTYAKEAVKQMQMAGMISGKNGNLFDPQGTATRAEVSAVLRRFVELANSGDTAQGWTMNDSGKWMYYENGKPFIGKEDIDGSTYTFDPYGETADVPKEYSCSQQDNSV